MPPSDATSQYPWPSGVAAMPTIGRLSRVDGASPSADTVPSLRAVQYPPPSGVAAIATAAIGCGEASDAPAGVCPGSAMPATSTVATSTTAVSSDDIQRTVPARDRSSPESPGRDEPGERHGGGPERQAKQ